MCRARERVCMCVSVIIKQFINVNCADISCELIKPDTEMVWLNMLNWQFNWYCLKKQNQNEEKEDKKKHWHKEQPQQKNTTSYKCKATKTKSTIWLYAFSHFIHINRCMFYFGSILNTKKALCLLIEQWMHTIET